MTLPVNTAQTQKRDRRIIYAVIIVALIGLWLYQASMALAMLQMGDMEIPLTGGFLAWLIWMWSTMMLAMMLPSALPMITTYATINRKKAAEMVDGKPLVSTLYFTLGYLLLWVIFSVGAGVLQWLLHKTALLTPMMKLNNDYAAAILLIAAGLYQLTPLKKICLKYCRTPLGFIMSEYREGNKGAFIMGLRHGGFCIGCCWILMALLFFGGVMNLYWIVGLALYVLLEKVVPMAQWMSYLVGIGLCLWGVYVLF